MSINLIKSTVHALALAAVVLASNTWAGEANPAAGARSAVQQLQPVTWKNVSTEKISAGGVSFSYRELGQQNGGTPVVLLVHLAAVLDNWDPRIVDGLAAKHHVIAFDNRGIGSSTGKPANTIEQMADDAISFIKAKGFKQVDLFGFSMGGMIAQEVVLKEPQLVRKMILAGTGPAGGEGISTVAGVANYDLIRATLTGQDPKQYLFFTRTPTGIEAGKAFLQRLQERSDNRDPDIAIWAYVSQLQALRPGGKSGPPTCRWSSSRCSWPTATTTGWCLPATPMTWPSACRMRSWSSTRMRGTAASSSTTRTSCPRHWPSSPTESRGSHDA